METSDNARREREIAREYMKKSKSPGDYYWRMAHMYTGWGDHVDADYGETPESY